MSTRKWISLMMDEMFRGMTIYWMRHDGGQVALHACASVRTAGCEQKTAERAESVVCDVAKSTGTKEPRSGSFMRRNKKGEIVAVGVAEILWSPRVESELSRLGLVEVR